jgi:hypothetical protein
MAIIGIDSRGLIGCLWTQLYYVSITKNQLTCPSIKKAEVSSSLRLLQVNLRGHQLLCDVKCNSLCLDLTLHGVQFTLCTLFTYNRDQYERI